MAITADTSPLELAALVSQALAEAGITAVLSGGAAVSVYTENKYVSDDLDFVTSERVPRLAAALGPLGFVRREGRYFVHPDTPYFVEFPPGPPAVGSTVLTEWDELKTEYGSIPILSPT